MQIMGVDPHFKLTALAALPVLLLRCSITEP